MNYPDIEFTCPHCEVTLKMRPDAEGLTGPCPRCREPITAPEVSLKKVASKKPEPKPKPPAAPQKGLESSPPSTPEPLVRTPKQRPISEENHRRKKPKSAFAILKPFFFLALAGGAAFAIVNYQKTNSDSTPENLPKEPESVTTKPPEPVVISLPPEPPIADPAPEPEVPPLKVEPATSKKLAHDPRDLSRPGEIPAISPKVANTFLQIPSEGSQELEVYVTQSAYCFEDLPSPEKKATVRIFEGSDQQAKEIGKAYLAHESPVYKKLAAGLRPGAKQKRTVTVKWNRTEDSEKPYLEVIKISAR